VTALETYLIGEPEVDDETVPVPENLEQADWQVRKIARLRRMMDENEAIAFAEIGRIREWLAEENCKLARRASFFEDALRGFHRHLLEFDAKRKTVNLPAGTLRARQHPAKVDVIDAEVFVRWAMAERPALVRTRHEPDKTAIKQMLAVGPSGGDYGQVLVDPTSGEEVPGVVLVEGATSFTVDAEIRGVSA